MDKAMQKGNDPNMQPGNLLQGGLLRLPQVLSLIPVSRSSWWKGIKEGRFPKPLKLSKRITVWKASDIRNLIER